MVDYIQNFRSRGGVRSKMDEADHVMHELRRIANNGAAVLAISGVNRDSYWNAGLGAFKESGFIEYSADDAYVLKRPEGSNLVTVRHLKSRNGQKRDIHLEFVGKFQTFLPAGELQCS